MGRRARVRRVARAHARREGGQSFLAAIEQSAAAMRSVGRPLRALARPRRCNANSPVTRASGSSSSEPESTGSPSPPTWPSCSARGRTLARARQAARRRGRHRHLRRDRAQLLPLGRRERARAPVGRDLRARPGALRLPPGRLRRGRARGPGGRARSASPSSTSDVGYASTLVRGEAAVAAHMQGVFPDWRARAPPPPSTRSEAAGPIRARPSMALAGMARTAGARIVEGVEVIGFDDRRGGHRLDERRRDRAARPSVSRQGPWARDLWRMLDLPPSARRPSTTTRPRRSTTGRCARATTLIPRRHLGSRDPVVHLDADVPLVADGTVLYPAPWGVYFRPSITGASPSAGSRRPRLRLRARSVRPVPSGARNDEPGVRRHDDAGARWALGRFDGTAPGAWKSSSSAAQTCFTPDSYPVVGAVARTSTP